MEKKIEMHGKKTREISIEIEKKGLTYQVPGRSKVYRFHKYPTPVILLNLLSTGEMTIKEAMINEKEMVDEYKKFSNGRMPPEKKKVADNVKKFIKANKQVINDIVSKKYPTNKIRLGDEPIVEEPEDKDEDLDKSVTADPDIPSLEDDDENFLSPNEDADHDK